MKFHEKKELDQICVIPKIVSESIKQLARPILTYNLDETSNFGGCIKDDQGAYKAGRYEMEHIAAKSLVKADQNATNLCIMLLIQHCGRNSAARSSGGAPLGPLCPPFRRIVDRPIFSPACNSGFGYKSRLSVTYRRAKAAILLSYFLFNSHQAIVYRINTRQLRRGSVGKRGSWSGRPPPPGNP